MIMRRHSVSVGAAAIIGAALLTCAGGCLTFEQRWKEAATHLVPADSFCGRWQGTWSSEEAGHHGPLRCIVTPLKSGRFEARFHARYGPFLPYERTVRLSGEHRGGLWHYSGEADLGWLAGGIYTYRGKISPSKFFGTYESRKDYGAFEMTRPE